MLELWKTILQVKSGFNLDYMFSKKVINCYVGDINCFLKSGTDLFNTATVRPFS